MDLVKFIDDFLFDEITDPYQREMVENCLFWLHEFYGFNEDEWVNEALTERQNEENYPIQEILDSVSNGIVGITNDILIKYYKEEIYKYKDRKLFRFRGNMVLDDEVYIHSLFNILGYFVNKDNDEEQDWLLTVRLYEKIPTIRLLKWMNINLIAEMYRNVDLEKVSEKNKHYDSSPLNKIRKELVQTKVLQTLFDDETITFESCCSTVLPYVEKQLEEMNCSGDIPITYGDPLPISTTAFKRWVQEMYTEFNKEEADES